MKTRMPFKKAAQGILVTVMILTSVLFAKNIIKNVKYLYGLEPAGSGMACFYDIIQ